MNIEEMRIICDNAKENWNKEGNYYVEECPAYYLFLTKFNPVTIEKLLDVIEASKSLNNVVTCGVNATEDICVFDLNQKLKAIDEL